MGRFTLIGNRKWLSSKNSTHTHNNNNTRQQHNNKFNNNNTQQQRQQHTTTTTNNTTTIPTHTENQKININMLNSIYRFHFFTFRRIVRLFLIDVADSFHVCVAD